ncbi:DUF1428 domain-containing protein [Bordetella sp. 2513F-2]
MEQYIDGFLLAVPKAKMDQYRAMAQTAGQVWKELGALDYRECVEDDIDSPNFSSFRAAAGAQEGEVVVFSWILYASKADRDHINAAIMEDPRLKDMPQDVFDCKRMTYGGFTTLVLA